MAMKRRQEASLEKLEIVLQGLKSELPVAKVCNRHQIGETQRYLW
jgi:transposase-like protein